MPVGPDRRPGRWAALLALAALSGAGAQDDPVPRAPRIDERPAAAPAVTTAPPGTALRPPSATRLAPLPEDRATQPEEIIVIGKGWRLPDLGSRWREQQAEAARSGSLNATLLPLYDPSVPSPYVQSVWRTREEQRHGYIELFRVRFGRRSRD